MTSDHPSPDTDAIRLFQAVGGADLNRVKALLKEKPILVHTSDRHTGRTALHYAAAQGNVDIAEVLLNAGADVKVRERRENATPLHFAAERGSVDLVRLLVERGAEINDVDDAHERGPLGWATVLGAIHAPVAEFLLSNGARFDLFTALALGTPESVRALIKELPETLKERMSRLEERRSPLHLSVLRNWPEMTEVLIAAGAEIDARTSLGITPLALASEADDERHVELLLANGAELELSTALALGELDHVEAMLEGDPGQVGPEGAYRLILHYVARIGSEEAAHVLMRFGADPAATEWDGAPSALAQAARHGQPGVLKALLDHGANPNARGAFGGTALHWGAYRGHPEIAALLIKRGANLELRDLEFGGTPVFWAVHGSLQRFAPGHAAILEMLLHAGAPANTANKWGETALQLAMGVRSPLAETLKQFGA